MGDAGQENKGLTPVGSGRGNAARRGRGTAGRGRRRTGGRAMTRRTKKRSGFNLSGCLLRIILVLIVCVAVFFFLQSDVFTVKSIEVRGLERVNEDDIVALANIETGVNLFSVNRHEAEELIALHPAVADVSVNTRPPHKILITITEREAVAWIPGDECYYLLDEDGYIFIKRDEYNDYLPLITGLELPDNLSVGLQFTNVSGLSDAISISKVFADYCRGQLRELHYTAKGNFVFFIGDLKIYLGKNEDMWKKKNVLDGILQQIPASKLSQVEYIDLSSPSNPVVKGYDIVAEQEKEAEQKKVEQQTKDTDNSESPEDQSQTVDTQHNNGTSPGTETEAPVNDQSQGTDTNNYENTGTVTENSGVN